MNDSTTKSQTADPVLAEVWRIKEEIAAEHGDEVRKIAASAIEAQKEHPERIVDLSKAKPEQGGAHQPATPRESKAE